MVAAGNGNQHAQANQGNAAQDDAELDLYSGVGDVPGLFAGLVTGIPCKGSATLACSVPCKLCPLLGLALFSRRLCLYLGSLQWHMCLKLPATINKLYMHNKLCLGVHLTPVNVKVRNAALVAASCRHTMSPSNLLKFEAEGCAF